MYITIEEFNINKKLNSESTRDSISIKSAQDNSLDN